MADNTTYALKLDAAAMLAALKKAQSETNEASNEFTELKTALAEITGASRKAEKGLGAVVRETERAAMEARQAERELEALNEELRRRDASDFAIRVNKAADELDRLAKKNREVAGSGQAGGRGLAMMQGIVTGFSTAAFQKAIEIGSRSLEEFAQIALKADQPIAKLGRQIGYDFTLAADPTKLLTHEMVVLAEAVGLVNKRTLEGIYLQEEKAKWAEHDAKRAVENARANAHELAFAKLMGSEQERNRKLAIDAEIAQLGTLEQVKAAQDDVLAKTKKLHDDNMLSAGDLADAQTRLNELAKREQEIKFKTLENGKELADQQKRAAADLASIQKARGDDQATLFARELESLEEIKAAEDQLAQKIQEVAAANNYNAENQQRAAEYLNALAQRKAEITREQQEAERERDREITDQKLKGERDIAAIKAELGINEEMVAARKINTLTEIELAERAILKTIQEKMAANEYDAKAQEEVVAKRQALAKREAELEKENAEWKQKQKELDQDRVKLAEDLAKQQGGAASGSAGGGGGDPKQKGSTKSSPVYGFGGLGTFGQGNYGAGTPGLGSSAFGGNAWTQLATYRGRTYGTNMTGGGFGRGFQQGVNPGTGSGYTNRRGGDLDMRGGGGGGGAVGGAGGGGAAQAAQAAQGVAAAAKGMGQAAQGAMDKMVQAMAKDRQDIDQLAANFRTIEQKVDLLLKGPGGPGRPAKQGGGARP